MTRHEDKKHSKNVMTHHEDHYHSNEVVEEIDEHIVEIIDH
jgi:hypothetical protein